MDAGRWHTNRESLLLAIADHLGRLLQETASFVIATVSDNLVVGLDEDETIEHADDFEAFRDFVTEELWDTVDAESRTVAEFDFMHDYATMSLSVLPDGRCIVWWNDEYVRHLPIGLLRSEAVFPDFFEAYNARWQGLTPDDAGGEWGGEPVSIVAQVPRAVVMRTVFRFRFYSSDADGSEYYERLVEAGQAEIHDDELAMPPWVREQDRDVWQSIYAWLSINASHDGGS